MAEKTSAEPTVPAESQAPEATQNKEMTEILDSINEIAPAKDEAQPADAEKDVKPSEDPAKPKEPEGKPEEAKDQKTAGKEKAGSTASAPAKDSKTQDQQETTYEVIGKDGVKQIPVSNLITTYQQFPELQRRYTAVKPLVELAEKTGLPANQILPFLELGIKTAMEQQGKPTSGSGAAPSMAPSAVPGAPADPNAYNGPFKDAKEDTYYKELDPGFHASQWRLWNAVSSRPAVDSDLRQKVEGILQFVNERANSERQAAEQEMVNRGVEAVDKRIQQWSGDKNDYFSDPKVGKQKTDSFREFLFNRFPEVKIADLSPEFLSAAFAQFDPKYYNGYLMRLSRQQSGQRIFVEGGAQRGAGPAKLTDQQEAMADMMDLP
jgi:hypothetical protein